MSTWQQKYLKKDGLNETQIRILDPQCIAPGLPSC